MKHETVNEYYGQVLSSSGDLQTNACCTPDAVPAHLRPILAKIHPEVGGHHYGCGSARSSGLAHSLFTC